MGPIWRPPKPGRGFRCQLRGPNSQPRSHAIAPGSKVPTATRAAISVLLPIDIDIGHSKFEPVYNSTFDAISSSEEAGATECSDAVRRLIDAAQGKRATQKSDDVVQLYAAAASIREQVRRLMKAVAGETGAELAEIPEKARRRHGLKQIVRIVEKCALRPDEPGKADRVCDIVRDMFSVSSMEQMAKVAVALLSCSEIAIVRVKDRNAEASAGGWRDIMINFVLVGDENAHVCEVQLVHKKMLLQRKEMVRPSRSCPLVIATSPRAPRLPAGGRHPSSYERHFLSFRVQESIEAADRPTLDRSFVRKVSNAAAFAAFSASLSGFFSGFFSSTFSSTFSVSPTNR